MKRVLLKAINLFFTQFGVKLVRNTHDQFAMSSGLQRIADHGIEVRNIIDIGASDGKWSMSALRFFPDAQFQAIEPLNEREAALKCLKQKQNHFDYELCVAGATNNDKVVLNVAADLDGSTVWGGEEEKNDTLNKKQLIRSYQIRTLKAHFF